MSDQCTVEDAANFFNKPHGLQNSDKFYDYVRKQKLFGPTFDNSEFQGCEAVLAACAEAKWPLSWTAYAFATAYHETAKTMQPITEYGGPTYFTKMYDITGSRAELARKNGNTTPGDGPKYCGRGYVQLTWKNNYKHAGDKIGVDLVSHPELALDCNNAARIMIGGMSEGWFTSKSCSTYLPESGGATKKQYMDARRIINGQDKAELIAQYALIFENALSTGGWQ